MPTLHSVSPNKGVRGAGTTFGPSNVQPSSTATSGFSEGSATAAGHGDHPRDNADDSNVIIPRVRIGPQTGDLEGEKLAPAGNGKVMAAQLDKQHAGWGEEKSLTRKLEKQKAEQQEAREQIHNERVSGTNVDGGAGRRALDEGADVG
jgi:hypothetical protein